MKRVTFSAEDELVEKARAIARAQGLSLSAACREWLLQFTTSENSSQGYDALMESLQHIASGRHFSRDENE